MSKKRVFFTHVYSICLSVELKVREVDGDVNQNR